MKKTTCDRLLDVLRSGSPVLTGGDQIEGVPSIQGFPGKYHPSVRHLGYGCFRGTTEHGEFSFDGGSSMYREDDLSWTKLSASDEVLADLGYDIPKVIAAIEKAKETAI